MPKTLPNRAPHQGRALTLAECNAMLPLIQKISTEITERRDRRRALVRIRDRLSRAHTPEGLSTALGELDARIYVEEEAIRHACKELDSYGLTVLRVNPLVVHFPGRTRDNELVFCWQEGDETVSHGHPHGHEEDPRQPLRLRGS